MVESRCKTHLQLNVFPKIYFLLPSEISVSVVEEIGHFYLKIKEIWTSDAVEISDGNKNFVFKKCVQFRYFLHLEPDQKL